MALAPRPPAPDRQTIAVSRNLLIGLSAALGLALLVLAFLIGRQTAAPPPAEQASVPSAAPQRALRGATRAAEAAAPASLPPEVPDAAAESPAPAAPTAVGSGTAEAPADPALRTAVARYFAELDTIEAVAKTWSDPQQLAAEIVQQAAGGSSAGFDSLLATQRQARERLRTMNVPVPCREHHAQVEVLMDEAIGLLANVRQAAATGDFGALQESATAAHEMEAKTKRLEALATSLKRRYVASS